jgi:hypothetical protein
MAKLEELFSMKLTENGDVAFNKVSFNNQNLNTLFGTEYYQNHLNEVTIGNTPKDRLFSMFIRDPRYGLGKRDLGRRLMKLSNVSLDNVIKAGRFDDVFAVFGLSKEVLDYAKKEIENGNELVKKWMPRYSSQNLLLARKIAEYWGMTKQEYGHFIKCNTTENKLSRKNTNEIIFEHVPSLAMLKYYKRFNTKEDTAARFKEYIEAVKGGKKDLKVATTTVYDIYRNANSIDPDVFFEKLEKISGSWLPIVDTSESMCNENDSFGKALAIGHYLGKCSTYAPNTVVSFSSRPQLIKLGVTKPHVDYWYGTNHMPSDNTQYGREIRSMYTGDCTNTDFGAVMNLLKGLDDTPKYLVVLSDMEFDQGSRQSKNELKKIWKENGYTTKIVWWNLHNGDSFTAPEMDSEGNIFLSGYNPMLLKFLEAGFDGEKFLDKLLSEYEKVIS